MQYFDGTCLPWWHKNDCGNLLDSLGPGLLGTCVICTYKGHKRGRRACTVKLRYFIGTQIKCQERIEPVFKL